MEHVRNYDPARVQRGVWRRNERASCVGVRLCPRSLRLAVVASLVVRPLGTGQPERRLAGTVVIIHEQEPPSLRGGWIDNNLLATGLVTNNIWYGGQIYDSKAVLRPRLFEGKPKLVKKRPQTVTFKYKASAVWSDGKPVTCEDWKATWRVFVNPQFNVVSREGWKDIKSVTCNGKSGTIVFARPFAAWETLASGGVYAAHVIRGRNMNQMFNDSIPVSSGPWKFQSWQRGVQLTLVKNPRFKAGPPMKLDRVVFRFILDTNARFQAMKAGEGHLMEPQPQLQIADIPQRRRLQGAERARVRLRAHRHPAWPPRPSGAQAAVRPAGAGNGNQPLAARKRALQDARSGPAQARQPRLQAVREGTYRPHFGIWRLQPEQGHQPAEEQPAAPAGPMPRARATATSSRAPASGRLSFRFFTTAGNQLRTLAFEVIDRQLKSVGIELIPRFQTAGTLFGGTLPSGDWDLMMFTYGGGPTRRSRATASTRAAATRTTATTATASRRRRSMRRRGSSTREAARAPEPRRRAARRRPAVDPAVHPAEVRDQRRRPHGPDAQHDE